ncbi:High mobility group B protein [Quillaja saponaria]|uniref:High mobility group B protein n=1 Tax=Quillaja saponaria TaxID=32244 RepID=A0AAD7PQK4_QUISA|nr:High mobility group B protein [Quillaja saponaria]
MSNPRHLSEDPTTTTKGASAISSPQQQLCVESANGQSTVTPRSPTTKSYPSATAEYEEVAPSADLFWEKLKSFHNSFGTKFNVPTVGGKDLDLHRLFVEVTSRGGLQKVIRDRQWKKVILVFNFPTTVTNASFVLRKFYLSLLYHFEQVYYFHKQVPSFTSKSVVNGSATTEEGAVVNELPDQVTPILQLGSLVAGSIDGKFDYGYLVTVNLNYVKLKEHYARLKPLYYGQERAISKRIGFLWNNLTDAERQVYQEKGLRDKERYRSEMLEYKSSYDSTPQ